MNYVKRPGQYVAGTDPMWVVGCITAHGAIIARIVKGPSCVTHTEAESKGKRWRWNIWGQEFHATRANNLDPLTDEELVLVHDWLKRNGCEPDDLTTDP